MKVLRPKEWKIVVIGGISLLLSGMAVVGHLFLLIFIVCLFAVGIPRSINWRREKELQARYHEELAQRRQEYYLEQVRQGQELANAAHNFHSDFGRYPTDKELASYRLTYSELLNKLPDERDRIKAVHFHDHGRYPTPEELDNELSSFRKSYVERWFNTFYGRDLNRDRKTPDDEPVGEMRSRNISRSVAMEVMARDKGTCQECGQPGQELDHIIPFSKGGANTAKNLRVLCQFCNRSKGAKY